MSSPHSILHPGDLAYAVDPIDRAAHLRADAALLAVMARRDDARVYVIHRDSLLVDLRGPVLQAALPAALMRDFGSERPTTFIGLRGAAGYFGREANEQALGGLPDGIVLQPLRQIAADNAVPPGELSAIAVAKSMVHWHRRHGFCANCGTPTDVLLGGWKRICPRCRAEHFPRTDPVVIMRVSDGSRCLLGRNIASPPGRWSCLAGFVEPAETMEDAVRREVFEETSVRCEDIAYARSQPWPFAHSLMIGCTARAATTAITVDRTELDDARWFEREEIAAMLKGRHPDGFQAPGPVAIAHHLLKDWLAER